MAASPFIAKMNRLPPKQGPAMTLDEDIISLKDRIAREEIERDAWRAAGREEKYLEAYFVVEALELRLDERLGRHGAVKAPS